MEVLKREYQIVQNKEYWHQKEKMWQFMDAYSPVINQGKVISEFCESRTKYIESFVKEIMSSHVLVKAGKFSKESCQLYKECQMAKQL